MNGRVLWGAILAAATVFASKDLCCGIGLDTVSVSPVVAAGEPVTCSASGRFTRGYNWHDVWFQDGSSPRLEIHIDSSGLHESIVVLWSSSKDLGLLPVGNYTFVRKIVDANPSGISSQRIVPFLVRPANPLSPLGVDQQNGWEQIDWFGFFNELYSPWVYHLQHGWMYPIGDDTSGFWMYTLDMGWIWTHRTVYPNMYVHNRGTWLYYVINSANPRRFYNWSTGLWEAH